MKKTKKMAHPINTYILMLLAFFLRSVTKNPFHSLFCWLLTTKHFALTPKSKCVNYCF